MHTNYAVKALHKQIITKFSKSQIEYRIDDEFLIRFLSVSGKDKNGNDDIDGAFNIYKNYYNCLLSINELNPGKEEFDFTRLTEILFDFVTVPDENPLHFYGFDSKNRAILGYITNQVNPKKPDVLLGQLLASLVVVEYLQKTYSKKIKKYGMIMVMDHGGLNLAHYQIFITNPFMLKLFADFYSTAIPISIHQQAVVNEAKVTNLLFTLAKPFIAKEMTEKIRFYGTSHCDIIEELGGNEYAPEFLEGGQVKPIEWPEKSSLENYLADCLPKLIEEEDVVINDF